jgi:drug/metabolite transporter (DMT)-like permease
MSDQHSHLWPGVPLALGSALLFGASPPLSKIMLADISPYMLAGLFYLGAGLGLAAYRLISNSAKADDTSASLSRRDWPWLAVAVIMGGVFGPLLLLSGLHHTNASTGALLLNVESIATMAMAWLIFRENVDRRLLIGAAAILAGALVLTWQGGTLSLDHGGLLIVLACVAWAVDNNVTRNISASDPTIIAMIKGLVAGSINIAIALAAGDKFPAIGLAITAAIIGFFTVGISLVLFIKALRHLGTARTGAYFALAPFIGALLSVTFIGDPLTMNLVLAGVLMAIGLWLHLTEKHGHDHEHVPLEHEHSHTHDSHHQHQHNGPVTEPHSHPHRHSTMRHRHAHYPDLHHRHEH